MFTRAESSRIRQEFWTTFGKYMSPIPSSEGHKINWVNYRTGIKDVHFRMETLEARATICISIEHKDAGIRELYFEQLEELKGMFEGVMEEEWEWKKEDGKVCKELKGVSVLNREDWGELIGFFKERMMRLDRFWVDGRMGFEGLLSQSG
ncbi:MAG TPA: DUF4268 domain-containing protein [Cyclobacteriaceae bacterium]|nr:DUF4268 domain-containing protein [Cyclobacteriaceae bacterium]